MYIFKFCEKKIVYCENDEHKNFTMPVSRSLNIKAQNSYLF